MFCFNTTPHTTTKHLPYEVVFGHKPRILSFLKTQDPLYNYDDFLHELRYRMQIANENAKKNICL